MIIWIKRIPDSTKITQKQENCLQINHLGNIIDSSVQRNDGPWGLGAIDINAGFQSIKTVFFKEDSLRRWNNSETLSKDLLAS